MITPEYIDRWGIAILIGIIGIIILIWLTNSDLRAIKRKIDIIGTNTVHTSDIHWNVKHMARYYDGMHDDIDHIYEQVDILADHLIDDKKHVCKNCIHNGVCKYQHVLNLDSDTDINGICETFEMKEK